MNTGKYWTLVCFSFAVTEILPVHVNEQLRKDEPLLFANFISFCYLAGLAVTLQKELHGFHRILDHRHFQFVLTEE
jgi:hypothetical protein